MRMNNKKNTKGPAAQVSKSAEKKSDVLIQIHVFRGPDANSGLKIYKHNDNRNNLDVPQ